ncbi:MAG: HAD family phosphatase [Candidatus Moranbacteria bacterium]|nr:HAD family phosphatase [Candidatus Moranbacteria bacterium]
MNSKISTIIFDLDGVIVDSEPMHFEAAKETMNEFGIKLTLEEYMEFGVAKGARNLFEKLSEKYKIDIDINRAFEIKKNKFQEIFEKNAFPRKGILELLESFEGKYTLAIASSGTRESVMFVLDKLNIANKFSLIVVAEDVSRVKPFPDIYNKTVQMLGVDKDYCVAIEDSATGVTAAKEAGIRCLAVPCEFTKNQNFSDAYVVLENIEQIADFVEKLT